MKRSMRKLNRRRHAPWGVFILTALLAGSLYVSPPSVAQTQPQDPNRLLVQSPAGSNPAPANANRYALVLGNGAYTNAPALKNPTNDAADMAAALGKMGFNVAHDVNLNQRKMKFLIREFGKKLKDGGQGLFYFAGHGVQLRGRNYLIPVDADIQSEADVEDQGVDVNFLMGLMDEAGNGLNVIILDACRNNPFGRSFRTAASGLAQVDAPTGTLIAYATAPGRVASDGAERNGAYTAELLKQLSVPGLPVEELMKRVRANLKQKTNGQQIPWESSSLVGDFVINRPATADAAKAASLAASATPPAIEQEFWDSIKASTDPEDFLVYLKEFPTGPHAPIARNNARRLNNARSNAERTGAPAAASNPTNPNLTRSPETSPVALIQRSYALWRDCDYEQAITLATRALSADPNNADGYLIRGAAYLFRLDLTLAISDLNEALRWRPNNALVLRWRAMAYMGSGLRALGEKDVDAILRLVVTPTEAWEFEARGYAYYQHYKYDLAIGDLNEAIRLDPQYLTARVIRGAAYLFKSEAEPGYADLAAALKLNPKLVGAYYYRGLFRYLLTSEKGLAIEDFSAVIRLAPNSLHGYGWRGAVYGGQDKLDLALKDFSDAIRLGGTRYLLDRAGIQVRIGNNEAALRDYTDYLKSAPTESSGYSRRAQFYLGLNNYDAALQDYSEFIRLAPNDPEGYQERAKIYRKLTRIPQAEADERKAAALKPKP